jgi:hypothetical protein
MHNNQRLTIHASFASAPCLVFHLLPKLNRQCPLLAASTFGGGGNRQRDPVAIFGCPVDVPAASVAADGDPSRSSRRRCRLVKEPTRSLAEKAGM